MKELRRHLPEAMPLSGLSICAVADRVVVKEGAQPLAGGIRPVPARVRRRSRRRLAERDRAQAGAAAGERGGLVRPGVALEGEDAEARAASVRARRGADPTHPRRAHQSRAAAARAGPLAKSRARLPRGDRKPAAAIRCCSTTSACCSTTWTARPKRWRPTRRRCAAIPALADCHYNLALLCEELEKPKEAIRHMAQYRRLIASQSE